MRMKRDLGKILRAIGENMGTTLQAVYSSSAAKNNTKTAKKKTINGAGCYVNQAGCKGVRAGWKSGLESSAVVRVCQQGRR